MSKKEENQSASRNPNKEEIESSKNETPLMEMQIPTNIYSEEFYSFLTPRFKETYDCVRSSRRPKSLQKYQNPTFAYVSDLTSLPWHDVDSNFFNTHFLEITKVLEENWKEIRDEIQFINEWEQIKASVYGGEWKTFYLYNQGERVDQNCEKVPKTMKIVDSLPLLMKDCGLGYVYFSRIKPETKILSHCGPANLRIRVHLGLQIPTEKCWIRVGEETRTWKEGKCLVFDDSFSHQVENLSNEDRIVLLIDFFHPDLTPLEREITKRIFPHGED